mmetsp:Transcript_5007/g.18802  ORF Transcript_5007/g.18802 Transcript_5007/m.18802 type:complete len:97 (-) Transcript_5007:307-597(-)
MTDEMAWRSPFRFSILLQTARKSLAVTPTLADQLLECQTCDVVHDCSPWENYCDPFRNICECAPLLKDDAVSLDDDCVWFFHEHAFHVCDTYTQMQ